MKSGNGSFMQAYNAQAVVDSLCQVIVAADLSQQAADAGHLAAMLDQAIGNVGAAPEKLLADPGYFSEENVKAAEDRGVVPLIPPDRERCGSPSDPAPELAAEELAELSPVEKMRNRVSTQAGREATPSAREPSNPSSAKPKAARAIPDFSGF